MYKKERDYIPVEWIKELIEELESGDLQTGIPETLRNLLRVWDSYFNN